MLMFKLTGRNTQFSKLKIKFEQLIKHKYKFFVWLPSSSCCRCFRFSFIFLCETMNGKSSQVPHNLPFFNQVEKKNWKQIWVLLIFSHSFDYIKIFDLEIWASKIIAILQHTGRTTTTTTTKKRTRKYF